MLITNLDSMYAFKTQRQLPSLKSKWEQKREQFLYIPCQAMARIALSLVHRVAFGKMGNTMCSLAYI